MIRVKHLHPFAVLVALLSSTTILLGQEAGHPATDPPGGGHEQQARVRRHTLPMADTATYTVTAEAGVPEIPFRLVNNHLIIPVSINGSATVDTVLDTGMPAPGLALYESPRTRDLELDYDPDMQVHVGGAGGGGGREARMVLDATLELEGLEIGGAPVIALPAMDDFGGYHDAIIGYSLFERFVVELDYDGRLMRLHDPASWRPPADAHVVPLSVRNNMPFMSVRVTPSGQEPFDAEVVIDLGASHAISLNTDSSERITVPETSLHAVLGHGLSGPIEGEVGRIAALELAGARLTDVVASFPIGQHQHPRGMDSRAGNLGSEVLRRFTTIFDYSREQMILVPNTAFAEPFEWDHSGIKLGAGSRLDVMSIVPDSPAAESGVEVGDILTHIDGKPVTAVDYGTVRDALMRPGKVELTLERAGETLEKTMVLRRMI